MTEKVYTISHAKNKTGTITTSEVSAVMFPTSSKAGSPADRSGRNSTQRKLFSAALGFQRVHLLGFTLLGLALLGVVFLLPTVIEAPKPELIISSGEGTAPVVTATPDSPWSDAQLAKQRRQAQEVLSKILDLQSKLEEKRVELWGDEDFKQAMNTAAAGDEQYRQRKFSEAQRNYLLSLEQFETLYERVEEVYQAQKSMGLAAIDTNQSQQALDSYQMALYLKPDSLDAQQGSKRAQVLAEVMALVKEGKHLMKVKKFKDAKSKFDQALKLDAQSAPAQQQLAKAKQAISDENFASAMSDGYAAINQKQFDLAIRAFTQASNIRPKAQDAALALTQAKNKKIQHQIAFHLQQAESYEKQELWQQANDSYEKMQALDASVLKAKVGLIRTRARATLDGKLQDVLNKPERLTTDAVYREAQALYKDAVKTRKPGNRLRDQIARLDKLLVQVKLPVAVKFQSNNQTNVTLYKVGNLGAFSAKSMDLQPGKYTLIGTRNGYRDVRREFTLSPSEKVTTIVVQCEEKITNG
jgi:tetratricopeptide (TPR) repeat protein